ncbi:hypothetical protein H312_02059, partial [Anncaliia algerae PRA339]
MNNDRKNTIIDLYTKKLKVEKPPLINIETTNESQLSQKNTQESFANILNGDIKNSSRVSKNHIIKLSIKNNGMVELKPTNKIISSFLASYPSNLCKYENDCWYFDLSLYSEVKCVLKNNKLNFEEIPKGVLEIINKKFSENEFEFTHPIYKKLLPFQREGV